VSLQIWHGDDSVESLGHILERDPNALVRHEAAFSLGQLGFESGINPLSHAVESDPSFFVRHEAAIALGVIGSEKAREALIGALGDSSEDFRESALIALASLEYISTMRRKKQIYQNDRWLVRAKQIVTSFFFLLPW
jgi:HEAT repeat protein